MKGKLKQQLNLPRKVEEIQNIIQSNKLLHPDDSLAVVEEEDQQIVSEQLSSTFQKRNHSKYDQKVKIVKDEPANVLKTVEENQDSSDDQSDDNSSCDAAEEFDVENCENKNMYYFNKNLNSEILRCLKEMRRYDSSYSIELSLETL